MILTCISYCVEHYLKCLGPCEQPSERALAGHRSLRVSAAGTPFRVLDPRLCGPNYNAAHRSSELLVRNQKAKME